MHSKQTKAFKPFPSPTLYPERVFNAASGYQTFHDIVEEKKLFLGVILQNYVITDT